MKQLKIVDALKQRFSDLNSNRMLELFIFFLSGFVFGLLVKYFLRYIFWFLIFSLLGFYLFRNFSTLPFDYNNLINFFGIDENITFSQLLTYLVDFIKANVAETLAIILGLYLSWEVV